MTLARAIPPSRPSALRRLGSDTNLSLVISTALHLALFLLLGGFTAHQRAEARKLTEISYIEERYGEAVAKKVSLAPEKLAPPSLTAAQAPSLEGSIFAKGEATGRPPQPELKAPPAPVPAPANAANPFAAPLLKSRTRRDTAPALPRVSDDQILLSAGLTDNPRRVMMGSEDVDLKGQVLVGRKSRLNDEALFEVAGEDGPALASGALTLAVPTGGLAGGHPDLVGGTLAEGKEAYRGELPGGNLVTRDGSRDRLTALASLQVAGPGGSGAPGSALAGAGPVAPSAGTGLVSRGGSDAVSRGGGLKPRAESSARTAEAIARSIEPERSAPTAAAAAAPAEAGAGGKAEQGVSMTLSGPILDREILASQAPAYPQTAKQQGWQGTVSVYFTVLPDGTIKKVLVEQASPHQVLDEAAKRCLANWRFSPLPAGATAEQWGVLTIVFRLR